MITITINGITASGREGMSILDLAREMGIYIPTLCHDPHLASYGACRVCLVEDEKSGALLASCVTPLSPGMAVRTDSPKVLQTRKMVVKLMLASHPESCLVCDKGNRCQLRQIACELGIGVLDLYKLPNYTGTQEVNPFIKRDLSKCILCGKCIRADQELVVVGAIDYFHRGFDARPATLHDQPLEKSECTFCGACVDICPTGALSERDRTCQSTATKSVSSVCPYCACGCTLLMGVDGERVVGVTPDRKPASGNSPVLCVKGHYGWDFIYSPDRLKVPLIRKEGKLVESSWEEALDFVAGELRRIQKDDGPDALAFLGSSKCTNEENYLFQKLARAGLGTNNVDHGSPLNSLPSPRFFGQGLGWGAMTGPIRAIEEAKGILVIGANPEETAPVLAYKIKRAVRFKGAKLILVDPRKTRLASFAHAWLQPRAGKDFALLLGFMRTILDEGLWDQEGTKEKVEGLDELQQEINSFDLTWTEQETGINQETIRRAARSLTDSQPRAIIFGSGLWQGAEGVSSFRALVNLAFLIDSRSRFYPLGKETNGQGARDMGVLPDSLPGYQSWEDGQVRMKFERAWGKPLPLQKGLTSGQMILGAEQGKIRGMYIMGENPICSFPDSSLTRRALERLEFLVVQDLFLTETAQLAKVVFPACSFAEKEGTVTSAERRVQLLKAAVPVGGQSLPDWKILKEVYRRLGLSPNYGSGREIMEEIQELVPIYGGITYERLEKEGIHWPCFEKKDPGSPCLVERGFFVERRVLRSMPRPEILPEGRRDQGLFQLILGTALFHSGSGTRSSRSPKLMGFAGSRKLKMNPLDAEKLGLEEGSQIKVYSEKRGLALSVSLDDSLLPGTLFFPVSPPGEESVYDLLPFPSGRKSEFPGKKTIEVKIERI